MAQLTQSQGRAQPGDPGTQNSDGFWGGLHGMLAQMVLEKRPSVRWA